MVSKKLYASYVLDVVVLVVFGLISYAFDTISPHYHAFSLVDLTISYPFVSDTVSDTVLVIVSVVVPIIIIMIVVLLFVPIPFSKQANRSGLTNSASTILKLKLWEFFTAILGLALSLLTQFLIVQGLKNAVGKPRPDMLARCQPDLANVGAHTVGGFGQPITDRWVLVDHTICRQSDRAVLEDGFRSFPSGHSGTSFAGLLYLTLFLCSKFNAWFPYSSGPAAPLLPTTAPISLKDTSTFKNGGTLRSNVHVASVNQQYQHSMAAPPTWVLFLIYIPVGGALYICASRYFNYKHHGIDIISGALIGILTAYLGFRWYSPPLNHTAGWAWGPRSRAHAFYAAVGNSGWVDVEGDATNDRQKNVTYSRLQTDPTIGSNMNAGTEMLIYQSSLPAEDHRATHPFTESPDGKADLESGAFHADNARLINQEIPRAPRADLAGAAPLNNPASPLPTQHTHPQYTTSTITTISTSTTKAPASTSTLTAAPPPVPAAPPSSYRLGHGQGQGQDPVHGVRRAHAQSDLKFGSGTFA